MYEKLTEKQKLLYVKGLETFLIEISSALNRLPSFVNPSPFEANKHIFNKLTEVLNNNSRGVHIPMWRSHYSDMN